MCESAEEACPLGLAPTSAHRRAGDARDGAARSARLYTAEDFALSHPAHSVVALLRVNDIMHTGDEIPTSACEYLRRCWKSITRKNLGMTAICDDEMNIIGIFTGDLRRVFDTGVDMRNASIAEVMTQVGSFVQACWR